MKWPHHFFSSDNSDKTGLDASLIYARYSFFDTFTSKQTSKKENRNFKILRPPTPVVILVDIVGGILLTS